MGRATKRSAARTRSSAPRADARDGRTLPRQPITYANALGSRLSILCILDLTVSTTPPPILANYIGWLDRKAHGFTDPRYPSRIAVVIIPGNAPLPSDLAGKAIPLRSEATAKPEVSTTS